MRLKVAALLGVVVLLASYAYFSLLPDADVEVEQQLETAPKAAREVEAASRRGLVVRENPIVLGRVFDDDVIPVVIGLRNTGSRAVRINKVAGSCGCMRVGPVPAGLAPGEEAEIGFTLKLAGLTGRISKTVRVSSDDPTKPELRVRIEAEVSPRLVVKPRHAVVPVAEAGAERTVDLVVHSGSEESLAGLTAVSSIPGVAVTATVEGTSARLHVSVPPEVPRARGTITLRLGKHEKVLGLTDASVGGGGLAAQPVRRPRGADPRDTAETLDVVFTGEDRGQMEPCGCTGGMLGGLSRRHARIQAFLGPGVPFVVLSGGRLVTGGDEYDRLRFEAIVEALARMGFAAIGPTRREIALGVVVAEAASGEATPSLVATDVDAASAESRGLVGELRLDAGEGLLYVCGIAGPGEDGEPYPDPRSALRKLREDLSEYVPIVILANVGEDVARDLARSAGRPTLVLYTSGVTDPGPEDVEEGPVALAPFPAEGKYVGLARLKGRPGYGTWSVEYRPVESELPEDEDIVELRKAHLGKLRAADLVGKCAGNPRFTPHALSGEAPPPASEGDGFAGSASCAECHEEESRSWAGSRHARAMESLEKTGDDADPGCVACHTVGYGTGKGFAGERATPHLAHVGCESCHGPRALHVKRHSDPDSPAKESPAAKAQAACLACHDGKHDPDFDFETYWPRIAHGAAK